MNNPIVTSSGNFIKPKEFEGEGLVLEIVGEPALISPSDPKYGFKEGDNKGKTVRYYFRSEEGLDRTLDSTSLRLAHALKTFDVGDRVRIQRDGVGTETQYLATKA